MNERGRDENRLQRQGHEGQIDHTDADQGGHADGVYLVTSADCIHEGQSLSDNWNGVKQTGHPDKVCIIG